MFICTEHQMGYPNEKSVGAHRQFSHDGDGGTIEEVDALPEGYKMTEGRKGRTSTSQAAPNAAQQPAQPTQPTQPRVVESKAAPKEVPAPPAATAIAPNTVTVDNISGRDLEREDMQAFRLQEFLKGLGTPDTEVALIVNGYLNIDSFRTDHQALAGWLLKNMKNRANHDYIPNIVQQVLGPVNAPSIPVFPGSAPSPAFSAPASPWNAPPNRSTPWPESAYAPPWPYYAPQPPPAPIAAAVAPAASERGNSEVLSAISTLDRRLDKIEEDRRIDLVEQRHKDESAQHQRELDGLKNQIQLAMTTNKEESKDGPWDSVMQHLEVMRKNAEDDRLDKLTNAVGVMAKAVLDDTKQDTVGRTTEDVISQVAPLLVDKLNNAGNRVMDEVANFREQIIPKAPEPGEQEEELSVDEIEELGAAEQAALALRVSRLTEEDMAAAAASTEDEEPAEDEEAAEVDEGQAITEDSQVAVS